MRITKISVKGLFGMFDHEIPLNQDDRITIIHGPNGVGKTVLMRMVHGLFHYQYELLGATPFEELVIEFDNGDRIATENSRIAKDSAKEASLPVKFNDDTDAVFDPIRKLNQHGVSLREAVKDLYGELILVILQSEMHTPYWLCDKASCGEHFIFGVYTVEDMLRIDPAIHTQVYGMMPEWFASVRQSVSPKLISVMRSKSKTPGIQMLTSWLWNKEDFEKTGAYLVGALPDALEKIANELKSNSSLMRQLSLMDKYTTEKADLAVAIDMVQLQNNPTALNVLEERFLNAHEKIEAICDDEEYLAGKRFCDLINLRLLFKSVHLDEDEGIRVYTDDRKKVPLATLSSGEKQLCILYYQLLFEVKPDTLVMIDEPELSMNVVWQRNFLKDLQCIIELRNFDVLIATHSPEVIYDKWDWTVALGEKAGD
ncbi:MAG: AAA family ATPase [Chloroflexi bacterium]|nr:AAA family ATPase [Chloroflexota bacterium]